MEAVIFIGIQATGKSSFYLERFWRTHVRINMDMLRTRHREALLLRACVEGKQPFVVDNTNPSASERARYIAPARAAGFLITGYYFRSSIGEALKRNALRADGERVLERGILGTHKRLQLPARSEGFDELFYVTLNADGRFEVEEWSDEV
jgi:predicted kinase